MSSNGDPEGPSRSMIARRYSHPLCQVTSTSATVASFSIDPSDAFSSTAHGVSETASTVGLDPRTTRTTMEFTEPPVKEYLKSPASSRQTLESTKNAHGSSRLTSEGHGFRESLDFFTHLPAVCRQTTAYEQNSPRKSTLLPRAFSLSSASESSSGSTSLSSQASSIGPLSQSSISSTYSSLLARNETVFLRPSMLPLQSIKIDILHNALEDFVNAMMPDDLTESALFYLPQFGEYYEESLHESLKFWRAKHVDEICDLLKNYEKVVALELALAEIQRWKEEPGRLDRLRRHAIPSGALDATQSGPIIEKKLRSIKKLNEKTEQEISVKRALVVGKANILMGKRRRCDELVVRSDEVTVAFGNGMLFALEDGDAKSRLLQNNDPVTEKHVYDILTNHL